MEKYPPYRLLRGNCPNLYFLSDVRNDIVAPANFVELSRIMKHTRGSDRLLQHSTSYLPPCGIKNIRQTMTKTNKKAYQIVSNDVKWCQIMSMHVCLSFMFHVKHIRQIFTECRNKSKTCRH